MREHHDLVGARGLDELQDPLAYARRVSHEQMPAATAPQRLLLRVVAMGERLLDARQGKVANALEEADHPELARRSEALRAFVGLGADDGEREDGPWLAASGGWNE